MCLEPAHKRPSALELLNSEFLNDLESEKNNHPVKVTEVARRNKAKPQLSEHRHSIIPEEEEENASEEEEKKARLQPPQPSASTVLTPNFRKPESATEEPVESPDKQGKSPTLTVTPTQIPSEPLMTHYPSSSNQVVTELYDEQKPSNGEGENTTAKEEDNKLDPQPEESSSPASPIRNRAESCDSKSSSRTKSGGVKKKQYEDKLNESVNFLKKIDKKKHKKLQSQEKMSFQKKETEEQKILVGLD